MAIELVAYAYLHPGSATPACRVQRVSAEISGYLEKHLDDLVGRAQRGSSAPAYFRGSKARSRVADLLSGTNGRFLAAAQDLTDRLHTAMDNRSERGFLVALRRSADRNHEAGVLKLDVHDEPAAVARAINGDLLLEAVQDLLDLPGDLQKGAVYPDPRADSEVVVGDKVMTETAQYFLRALEVQQIAAVSSSTKAFVDAVGTVAVRWIDDVVKELDAYDKPITPQDFFQEHPAFLSETEQQQVLARLEEQQRPVRTINPVLRPPKVVVAADGITIRGGVAEMDKVSWRPHDGGWRIQIDVPEEPRKRYE